MKIINHNQREPGQNFFYEIIISNFRGKVKPSQLIENLINYRNEDKERCNMLLLMLVVGSLSGATKCSLNSLCQKFAC